MTARSLGGVADLPAEAALVLCCATMAATRERTARARELAARVGSWERVIEIAKRHAVLPLVHRYLDRECRDAIPPDALAKIRKQWQLVILYNRHLTAELVRLMASLEQAGVAAVTFKGPVLALMSYGSIELRQFVDLDIMVRQRDLPRVAEIVTKAGYRSPHRRREGLATGYFQEYEDAFYASDGIGAIDVHWNTTPRSFRFAPSEEAMWARARRVELADGNVVAITPEDLLLYLCVHAAKHGWSTLGWICDVAETIRATPAIDLKKILDEASALGSRRIFLTGMLLASGLLDAPIDGDLVETAWNDAQVRALAEVVASELFSADAQGRTHFDPWAVPLRSIESTRGRINYVVRRMLAPTMGDYELIPLPTVFFPLYWVIRPFRMAFQYGPRMLRASFASKPVRSM